jgi:eukaryotic-like serine/threonine-protein kinase
VQTDRTPAVLADRYVLEEELARNGMGPVWRAADRVLGRTVAVEVIHPDLGDDPAFVERSTADARILARISDPHLTRLLDTGSQEGVRFVVREFIVGETLRERLTRAGRLTPERAAAVAVSVLSALEILHDHRLLHLDVRPESVLLADDGRVLLRTAAITPAVFATRPPAEAAAYLGEGPMAPELMGGSPPDARTDVYATGALLHEMLTGAPPTSARLGPRETERRVPRPLDLAVRRSLAPDPQHRFAGAAEFARAIESHARPGHDTSTGPSNLARATRSWLTTWLLVPVGVLVTAAIVIAFGLSVGALEVGGPLGIRAAPEESPTPPAIRTLAVSAVTVSDPFGDGIENDDGAAAAIDGNGASAWRSSNYFDGTFGKPGVGLVFDLGSDRLVTGFRLETPHPGFSFTVAVGDDPSALADPGGPSYVASAITRGAIDPVTGRYVMVWMTSVVPTGDGNRAEISEFKVLGRDA